MAELTRGALGNQAAETGELEAGADAWSTNSSTIPEGREAKVEVAAKVIGGEMVLDPESGYGQALMEIQEGPLAVIEHTLLEEPEEYGLTVQRIGGVEVEVTTGRELELMTPREKLVWYGMHPEYYGAVLGDRIMVLKDILESEYSCRSCGGKGYDDQTVCGNCAGTQKIPTGPCPSCRVLGYNFEATWSCGCRPCVPCMGTGWKRGIVIPEQAQQEAITGIIVSLGPECRILRLGDRVVHSKYAGHELKVDKNVRFVLMRESEVLQILRQRPGVRNAPK